MEKLKLSYSRISDFDRNGARVLIKDTNVESKALNKGSLINDLLFETVVFEDEYMLKTYENPTATSLKLANIIIANYNELPTTEEILNIIEKNGFWTKTKDLTKLISNFDNAAFQEYVETSINRNNKVLVTPEMLLEAQEVVYALKTHAHSRHFFRRLDLKPEIPFTIEYNDVILRGIIDMVVLDHNNKTIRLVDLKTTARKHNEFFKSYIEYRYYLQAAVYTLAIKEIKKMFNVEDYTELPFQFLYVGLVEQVPVLYEMSEKLHHAALYGYQFKSGYKYKGLIELIEDIKYHHHHKVYDLSRELVENKGVLILNSDTIV